jgi:hypothetical protein
MRLAATDPKHIVLCCPIHTLGRVEILAEAKIKDYTTLLSTEAGLHAVTSWFLLQDELKNGEVFGRLDYSHDLSHDLSERTVYIPSASLCCYEQQRAITPSARDVLIAESLTKDSLLAVIQQRLPGMSNIINWMSSPSSR